MVNKPQHSVLTADKVSMTFNGGTDKEVIAFRNISFELYEGETLAIVGPSGCGKSTLFNIIAGLLTPTSGSVSVDGEIVSGARGHVGYMLQKDLLLPWRSVLDNVTIGLEIKGVDATSARNTAQSLITSYGLGGFESALPKSLSGGMRQRVAFMRTLALDPKVILLDEPFSALDFQTRLILQGDVKRIIRSRGKSAILVTHDIGEAISMADRVLVLSHRPGSVKQFIISSWMSRNKTRSRCDARPDSTSTSIRSGKTSISRSALQPDPHSSDAQRPRRSTSLHLPQMATDLQQTGFMPRWRQSNNAPSFPGDHYPRTSFLQRRKWVRQTHLERRRRRHLPLPPICMPPG